MTMIARPQIVSLLLLLAIAGCKSDREAQQDASMAASREQRVEALREDLVRENSGAIVGPVLDVLTKSDLAAVGEVPVDRLHPGDVVTFMDLNHNVIDTGVILKVVNDTVHVRYDRPKKNGRAPRQGDLMVRVPSRIHSDVITTP